ncbi:hypothetical protein RIF29_30632 [Crotalaria pallida]|uniref:Uncharacterized protein n=1 Tax=Crotalaria pallida TaxID=3830 RepID=A0AAN9EGD5_CROPI
MLLREDDFFISNYEGFGRSRFSLFIKLVVEASLIITEKFAKIDLLSSACMLSLPCHFTCSVMPASKMHTGRSQTEEERKSLPLSVLDQAKKQEWISRSTAEAEYRIMSSEVVVDRYPTWYKVMESLSPPLLEVPHILQLLEVPWWQLKITESDSSVQNLNKGERMRRMASSSGFLTLIRYFSLDNLLMEHVTLRCWSYDLLHADHLFSKLKKRCNCEAVVAEVDRILRPEGTLIVRDTVEAISALEGLVKSMHWEVCMSSSKDNEGLFSVQKSMWRPKELETVEYAMQWFWLLAPFTLPPPKPPEHYAIYSCIVPPYPVKVQQVLIGVYGIQHYVLILGSLILIPLVIVLAMGGTQDETSKVVSTMLFVSGLTTLLHITFGSRLPLIQGPSFVNLAPALAIINSPEVQGLNDNKFKHVMREMQGVIIIGSDFQALLGYCGLMSLLVRLINPVGVSPTIAAVGLPSSSYGFLIVGTCLEIGAVQIVVVIVCSLYFHKISVLGITHVLYSCLAVDLAMSKIYSWCKWENQATMAADRSLQAKKIKVMRQHITFIFHQTAHPWNRSRNPILIWMLCFLCQFRNSINKSDYLALHLGFIIEHKFPLSYNFHNYMVRSMDDEFQAILGISWPLWIYPIICIFVNIHDLNIYFWLSIIPVLLVMLIGTKLQHVVSTLALEIFESILVQMLCSIKFGSLIKNWDHFVCWIDFFLCSTHIIFVLLESLAQQSIGKLKDTSVAARSAVIYT